MKLTCFLLLAGVCLVHADTIRTAAGKTITARVLTYANGTFECEDDKRMTLRLAALTIQKIDFETPTGKLETRTQGKIETAIRRYENGAFHYEDAKGQPASIPAQMVTSAIFGAGNAKDVEQVTGGDLEKYVVKGQVTIFDFYADWCGPCRRLGPQLEELAKSDSNVVLRKINVDNNKSLAAKYEVRGIPHVIVFDTTGKNIGKLVGPSIQSVKNLVTKAKGKTS